MLHITEDWIEWACSLEAESDVEAGLFDRIGKGESNADYDWLGALGWPERCRAALIVVAVAVVIVAVLLCWSLCG